MTITCQSYSFSSNQFFSLFLNDKSQRYKRENEQIAVIGGTEKVRKAGVTRRADRGRIRWSVGDKGSRREVVGADHILIPTTRHKEETQYGMLCHLW